MTCDLSLQIYGQLMQRHDLLLGESAELRLVIPEDVPFEIILKAPAEWGDATIELGDIPLETKIHVVGSVATYHLSRDRYVVNHFGQCMLRIFFSHEEKWFQPVILNVLASKANALQAETILQHLSKNSEEILRFCFSKAQYGADQKASELQDPSLILQHAESIVRYLARSRGYLRNHYKSRLVSKNRISPRDERVSVDDTTVGWLFQNLDQLSASDRMDFDVSINGWKYRLNNIHHAPLTEDANVYENQVVLSLLLSVKERLTKYLREAQVVKLEVDSPLSGYVSFESLLSKIFPITGFWTTKCEELISEVNSLIMFFQKTIPCEALHDLRPTVTPFVRGNNVYRQIFNLAHQWYCLGVPSWVGQEYIVSLLSLPKLYEFFCLTAILEMLEDHKFVSLNRDYRVFDSYSFSDGMPCTRPAAKPYNYYSLSREDISIELFYEPKIWSFQDFLENKRLVDISHAKSGRWTYRMPDFLFRISNKSGESKYLIFDAKYSSPDIICRQHLPALVNKYLLGIGIVDSKRLMISQAPMLGVFSLHPNPDTGVSNRSGVLAPNHLNHRFGPLRHLVVPSIASIEVAPLRKSQLGDVMERLINL